jgi:hypothetical protein
VSFEQRLALPRRIGGKSPGALCLVRIIGDCNR